MALSKQKSREIILQLLYSLDSETCDPTLVTELLMEELATTKKNVSAALAIAEKIYAERAMLDEKIAMYSTSYDMDRIQVVTRNILRLALFELLFDASIPPKVAIAEAIRLSRKFATKESADFVNGILDALYKSLESHKTP